MVKKHSLAVDLSRPLFRWKVDAVPSLLYAVCCRMTESPFGWPKSEGFFIGPDFYWFNNWEDIWSHGDAFIDKFLKESRGNLPITLRRRYQAAFSELKKEIKKISKLKIDNLTETELRRVWKTMFKSYARFWLIITDVEVLSYAASNRMEKLIKDSGVPLTAKDISALTSFPERSYILEEEYQLFKISTLPEQKRETALSRHASRYSWILYGYHGLRPVDLVYFRKRLESFVRNKNAKGHFAHLEKYHLETIHNFSKNNKKIPALPRDN